MCMSNTLLPPCPDVNVHWHSCNHVTARRRKGNDRNAYSSETPGFTSFGLLVEFHLDFSFVRILRLAISILIFDFSFVHSSLFFAIFSLMNQRDVYAQHTCTEDCAFALSQVTINLACDVNHEIYCRSWSRVKGQGSRRKEAYLWTLNAAIVYM